MNTQVLIVLAGGAALWLWPRLSGPRDAQGWPLDPRIGDARCRGLTPLEALQQGCLAGTPTPQPPGATTGQKVVAIGGAAAATVGRLIGAGSLGTLLGTTALIASGIAAAGGILAWGIIVKGWFRGGEEALFVNPARDDFKALFARFNPYRDVASDPNGPGFYGFAWLMHELGRDDLMRRFNAADTRKEWEAVALEIEQTLVTNATQVEYLRDFVTAKGFPACTTTDPSGCW